MCNISANRLNVNTNVAIWILLFCFTYGILRSMKIEITIHTINELDTLAVLDRLGLLETNLIRRLEQMATVADLDAALDTVDAAIAKLGTDLTTTLADLAAKIAAGADVAPEVARAQAIAAKLTDFDSSVVAADQPPTA